MLTQEVGVGLCFVRDLEQGKKTLCLNDVLALFSKEVGVIDKLEKTKQ